ncbi:K(+)-transporting ATPase subunit F [Ensifer sp. B1-9]|uniref:K(+)-transporting ATPase subunit F n=1 Tax=Ensifer sp. B1-9 TaxID=3141455 RepID=UPI003D24AFCD
MQDPDLNSPENLHVRYSFPCRRHRRFCRVCALCARAEPPLGRGTMFEALIGLAVAVALAAYLVVTLVRPERF